MNTGYPRQQHQQQQSSGNDAGWLLLCTIMVLILILLALPWVLIGFTARYAFNRLLPDLHWKISLLLWLTVCLITGFIVYTNLQHLQPMMNREIDDYIYAAKHYQLNFSHWPLRSLWNDTWPVWLHTWQSIGIAGFVAELRADTRTDTTRTLRRDEQRRQRRAKREQDQAKRHTNRPAFIPDQIDGHMVIGVAIRDDEEE